MKKALLHRALRIARRQTLKKRHPQYKYYIHYTFLVQNNKIIVHATNTNQIPYIHYGYHNNPRNDKDQINFKPKFHSEINAYKRAIKTKIFDKSEPFEIINIRFNKAGDTRLAYWCSCCEQLMVELGCSRLHYTTGNGYDQEIKSISQRIKETIK